MSYRNSSLRSRILRLVQSGCRPEELAEFGLTPREEAEFRRAAEEAHQRAVRKLSPFSRFHGIRISQPFTPVPLLVAVITGACIAADWLLLRITKFDDTTTYPLVAASATIGAIAVAAVGWGIAGWVAHRNARVQHTINIIATRFSQPAFVNHLATFNATFGDGALPLVTTAKVDEILSSNTATDHAPVQSLRYILNYFEFISAGVERGDLDITIVEKNLRGNLGYYYDKCAPYISDIKIERPLALEAYTRLRDYFRDV